MMRASIIRAAMATAAAALTVVEAFTVATAAPQDFAYRAQVLGIGDSPAYRLSLPLTVYQKAASPDLRDLRVFNGSGEIVPFALERPVSTTAAAVSATAVAPASAALPLFPLKDDSTATLDAVRVTIESGKAAVNVQTGGGGSPAAATRSYLVDARILENPIAALVLEWPQDAPAFAGRLKVEASNTLADWNLVVGGAPIANLQSNGEQLIERRVELPSSKAKFWRLSWLGQAAPFVLTSIRAEATRQSVDPRRDSRSVPGSRLPTQTGGFAFDLGARVPVDRVNIELPETNTVVAVELQSRSRPADAWRSVVRRGFYRLNDGAEELRNGAVAIAPNTDRYWRARPDDRGGGLGANAPKLTVAWVPHEVVFVARGASPFFVAYGSAVAESAAVSLAAIPKNVSIARASLDTPQTLGGEARLQAPAAPYPWKTALLWGILLAGAVLLAWMAQRLAKDIR